MRDTKNSEITSAITLFKDFDLDAIAIVFRSIVVFYATNKLTQGALMQVDYHLPKYKK